MLAVTVGICTNSLLSGVVLLLSAVAVIKTTESRVKRDQEKPPSSCSSWSRPKRGCDGRYGSRHCRSGGEYPPPQPVNRKSKTAWEILSISDKTIKT